jgi:hypothetical protein
LRYSEPGKEKERKREEERKIQKKERDSIIVDLYVI